jgi:glutamine---fructose-6-phosphate transaminase (isomerizing)
VNPDGFLADVLAEPEGLARVLDAYAAAGGPLSALGPEPLAGRRVVLIGMGSSRFAALTCAAALRRRGAMAVAEHASTGSPTPPAGDLVAIGISASGGTAETVEALARHRGASFTVALTNRPEGDLGGVADVVLPLLAGEEAGGVACRTFQATLAILHLLAGATVDALRPAVDAQAALLAARDGWLPALLDVLESAGAVYAIAPAERLSSSLQAALMFREGPRLPADGTETGDWLHVDVYLSKHPGYTALLFGGSRFDAGVMEWARERGSRIVAVGRPVEGAVLHLAFEHAEDPLVASLVEVSVAELAAAALWRRRLDAGLMP